MMWRPSPIAGSILVATIAIGAYVVLPLQGDHARLGLALMVVLIASAIPLMWRILERVNASDRPVIDAVAYLGAVGTMAILIPSAVYVVVADLSPGSYAGLETKVDGVYFTVTIASTVGFGDIHPVSQLARGITTAHILASVILLGTLIRLVTRVAGGRVSGRFGQSEE